MRFLWFFLLQKGNKKRKKRENRKEKKNLSPNRRVASKTIKLSKLLASNLKGVRDVV